MRHAIVIALLVVGTAEMGCARPHLTPTHGLSYAAAFSRQPIPIGDKPPSGPTPGLDSQEAALISESYRRSLVPKALRQQKGVEEEPIILVAPQGPGGKYGSTPLAPSIPREK